MGAKKAVLFDLDGTLTSAWPHLKRFSESFLAPRGIPMTRLDLLRVFNGFNVRDSFRNLNAYHLGRTGRFLPDEFSDAAAAAYRRTVQDITVVPGMEAVLARLKTLRIPTAIVSNSSRETLKLKLRTVSLTATFRTSAFSAEDVHGRTKPDPLLLQHAARQMEIDIMECVLVGDSKADIGAAQRAGCDVYVSTADYQADCPEMAEEMTGPGVKGVFSEPAKLLRALEAAL